MVAGLDFARRAARLLQDGEREVRIGIGMAAVVQMKEVHRVVERRRRPLRIVGDRGAQGELLGGVGVAGSLQ
jgi:hypothetical protein